MKKVFVILAALALLGLGVVGLVQADETWDYSLSAPQGANASAGHSKTYLSSPSSVPLTATAYQTANGAPGSGSSWTPGTLTDQTLYQKSQGTGETGLGITNFTPGITDNEIQNNSYIVLNLTTVIADGFTSLNMGLGSVQQGEGYSLWGDSGTAGVLTLLKRVVNTGSGSISDFADSIDTFTLPLNFGDHLYISATPIDTMGGYSSSDVLLLDKTTAVPLPGALLLLGAGLVRLAAYSRRRKVASST